MPAKWHKYSYSAQQAERKRVLAVLIILILVSAVYALTSNLLVSTYRMNTEAMEPVLSTGDTLVITTLYRKLPTQTASLLPAGEPRRGDLVLIAPRYKPEIHPVLAIIDSFTSFVTFQRIQLFAGTRNYSNQPTIRRLIGFPGDTLYIKDFIVHVKPRTSGHFLTEFEMTDTPYDVRITALPAGWTDNLPFSGNFDQIVLDDDHYFVLADNRLEAGDSRLWGPIPARLISGKVLLRYWPLSRFGTLQE